MWINTQEDGVMHPDEDGDCLMGRISEELRNSDCIRLQFTPDTNPFDALRALDKIKDWIKKDMSKGFKKGEGGNVK